MPLRIQICWICVLLSCCSFVGVNKTQDPSRFLALEYYQWITSAEQEKLDAERRRLDSLPDPNNKAVVQLALLLSASSHASAQSESQALTLLQSLITSDSLWENDPDYQMLGELWRKHLTQRASLRQAQADNRDLQDKLDKLQQQVDVMMSIEKQLMEREQLLSE